MNKKELTEIKKAIAKAKDTTLRDIHLCYVSSEKEKVLEESHNFLMLPEEETFKYFDLFKKALSGGFGKTLFHIDVQDGEKEKELLEVMQSTETEVTNAYTDAIIENYNFPGNFLIIIGHGFYDYATRLSDGSLDENADNTYEYTLTLICPVELSKPGLSIKDGSVKDRVRDWVVGKPMDAILFPTFTDREPNVHEVLYYCKNNKESQEDFLEMIAGNNRPNSEEEDKTWFSEALKNDKDMPCSFDVVKEFQEKAREIITEETDSEAKKSVEDLRDMLEDAGLDSEAAESFVEYHKKNVENQKEVSLSNLTDASKTIIKGNDFTLKVDVEKLPDVTTKHIDGRTCLVIPLSSSNLLVNGIESAVNISK